MKTQGDIGLVGLGTMGSALSLNIAEKGFNVSVYNRKYNVTEAFLEEAGELAERVVPTRSYEELVQSLKSPRAIILLVPAGKIVDEVVAQIAPHLDPEDLIIDAGNANFRDTIRRNQELNEQGNPHMHIGIGISGGEEGARHGPSIMGGGPKIAWERVAPILEAVSAKFEDTPCATWMGTDGAGHFVKAVHNGIEYADMQIIAEAYGIMRDGLGMSAPEIGEVLAKWNEGPLQSYLIEISAEVAKTIDADTDKPLLDVILDKAGQKGTGRWTAIEAQHLAAPVVTIEAAVAARNISAKINQRHEGESIFGAAPKAMNIERTDVIDTLEKALLAGKIACYAQGFAMLRAASEEFDWALPLPEVAKVWRAGCIIRSAMLDKMADALADTSLSNLMFAPDFAEQLKANHDELREVVSKASLSGNPAPALSSALSYFDMMRTGRSTANMIQGQRDYFGWHSFERVDQEGSHHGPWAD